MLVIISLEPPPSRSEKYHSLSHSLTFLLSFGLRQLLQCMLLDIIRLFQKVSGALGNLKKYVSIWSFSFLNITRYDFVFN